jgi:hypothetical protein
MSQLTNTIINKFKMISKLAQQSKNRYSNEKHQINHALTYLMASGNYCDILCELVVLMIVSSNSKFSAAQNEIKELMEELCNNFVNYMLSNY